MPVFRAVQGYDRLPKYESVSEYNCGNSSAIEISCSDRDEWGSPRFSKEAVDRPS